LRFIGSRLRSGELRRGRQGSGSKVPVFALASYAAADRVQGSKVPYWTLKVDAFVKSPKYRHSREGGCPELIEITGFPPSRE
jgi:hypothetical protein